MKFITSDNGYEFPNGYEIGYDSADSLYTVYYYGDPLSTFHFMEAAVGFIDDDASMRGAC